MFDAEGHHDKKVDVDSRTITHLCFADDIDALAKTMQELEAQVEVMSKPALFYSILSHNLGRSSGHHR